MKPIGADKSKCGESKAGSPGGDAGGQLTAPQDQLKVNLSVNAIITAKELRASLPEVVVRVRRGAHFTVLYHRRPAFEIVPVDATSNFAGDLSDDPVYRAKALGRSTDRRSATDHDRMLYRV